MPSLFGYGLLTLDRFLMVERYPGPDEKCRAKSLHEAPGGPVPAALAFCARSATKAAAHSTRYHGVFHPEINAEEISRRER